jgi:hypothetical protein
MRTPAKGSADDRAPASPGMVKRARHAPAAFGGRRQRADFTNVIRVTAVVALGCALLAWGARVGSALFSDGEDAQILVHDRCPPPASRFVRARPLPGGSSTAQLIAKAKASGEPCVQRPRTVVTMSSFYGRHQNLPLVVESILAQTCPPDRIYVFLSLAPLIDREFRHNKTRSIGYWRGVRRAPRVDGVSRRWRGGVDDTTRDDVAPVRHRRDARRRRIRRATAPHHAGTRSAPSRRP